MISQGETHFIIYQRRLQAPPSPSPGQDSGKASGLSSQPSESRLTSAQRAADKRRGVGEQSAWRLKNPLLSSSKATCLCLPTPIYYSLLRKVWMVSPAQRSQPSRRRNRATRLPPAQMQDCHQAPRPTLSECGWGSGCAWATRGWPGPLTRLQVSEWPVSKTSGIYKAESGRCFLSSNSVTRGPHGAQVLAPSG